MQIWLGKQQLGQRERFPDEIDSTSVASAMINIANLINNPQPVRTEDSIDE